MKKSIIYGSQLDPKIYVLVIPKKFENYAIPGLFRKTIVSKEFDFKKRFNFVAHTQYLNE